MMSRASTLRGTVRGPDRRQPCEVGTHHFTKDLIIRRRQSKRRLMVRLGQKRRQIRRLDRMAPARNHQPLNAMLKLATLPGHAWVRKISRASDDNGGFPKDSSRANRSRK